MRYLVGLVSVQVPVRVRDVWVDFRGGMCGFLTVNVHLID